LDALRFGRLGGTDSPTDRSEARPMTALPPDDEDPMAWLAEFHRDAGRSILFWGVMLIIVAALGVAAFLSIPGVLR
jgi:hypothetical protein